MKRLRKPVSWLVGDRDRLVEKMWPHVKTDGHSPRERAAFALAAIRGDWLKRMAAAALLGVAIGFGAGAVAYAAPLHVTAHRLNLYDRMLAVTVRGQLEGPGTAEVWVDGTDSATHSAGQRSYGAKVRLHKGTNRLARTFFVQRLEYVSRPMPAGWPISLRYWNPDGWQPTNIDGAYAEVWLGGRLVAKGATRG